MSKGFNIAEEGHVVMLFSPLAATATAVGSSEIFSMKNWGHATIIMHGGEGSATCAIKAYECSAFTGSDRSALTFRYAQEATSNGDTLDAALAWASTATMGTGNVFVVIEIDGDELSENRQYVAVERGATAVGRNITALAILSGGRYQEDITATAIA